MSAIGATEGKLTATGAIEGKLVAAVKKLAAEVQKLVAAWSTNVPTNNLQMLLQQKFAFRKKSFFLNFFSAPMPPKALSVMPSIDHRTFIVNLEPPQRGYFKWFEIEINEQNEQGNDIISTQNILENSSLVLPLMLKNDEQNTEIKLAKFAAVYLLKVRCVSKNGQRSIRYGSQDVITG